MDAITAQASVVKDSLLPSASFKTYTKYWNHYIDWTKEKKIPEDQIYTENTLLVYFHELSESYSPSSLWTIFSCINCHFQIYKNINLNNFGSLRLFLKRKGQRYKPKKASVFTRVQVENYIKQAPNVGQHLLQKLVLLFGFYGGLRTSELTELRWNDIELTEQGIKVTIRYSKTDLAGNGHVFIIPSNKMDASVCPVNLLSLYKTSLDPNQCNGRVWRTYRRGQFINSPMGKNQIGTIPAKIATFLCLPNASTFTGHSFRRTSSTVLADEGVSLINLKRFGR